MLYFRACKLAIRESIEREIRQEKEKQARRAKGEELMDDESQVRSGGLEYHGMLKSAMANVLEALSCMPK